MRGRWETVGSPTSRAHGRPTATVAAFRGIPYAEAPIGTRRFGAPVPTAPWDGIRDATANGATPQRIGDPRALIPEPSVPGDDTLTVSVLSPEEQSRLDGLSDRGLLRVADGRVRLTVRGRLLADGVVRDLLS